MVSQRWGRWETRNRGEGTILWVLCRWKRWKGMRAWSQTGEGKYENKELLAWDIVGSHLSETSSTLGDDLWIFTTPKLGPTGAVGAQISQVFPSFSGQMLISNTYYFSSLPVHHFYLYFLMAYVVEWLKFWFFSSAFLWDYVNENCGLFCWAIPLQTRSKTSQMPSHNY